MTRSTREEERRWLKDEQLRFRNGSPVNQDEWIGRRRQEVAEYSEVKPSLQKQRKRVNKAVEREKTDSTNRQLEERQAANRKDSQPGEGASGTADAFTSLPRGYDGYK